jgi:lysyl-tRNA synthetase class 2
VNGTTLTNFGGHEIDLSQWRRFSMREAIIHFWPEEAGPGPAFADFRDTGSLLSWLDRVLDLPGLPQVWNDPEVFESEEYRRQKEHAVFYSVLGINRDQLRRGEPTGKTIASIFELVAEKHLIQPTIIYDFPVAVSPLSKNKPDEPDWVERFEFYVGGFELGNAFSELNDPEEQRKRFEQQLSERERGDAEAHVMDEDYVRALAYGLPPTAGEGIGIDRLTMVLTGAKSIRDVILFPLLRSQTGESAG